MPNLSNRLTLLREKQGWSKAETARRLGLKAPSTYGNWEYGIREPDLEMVTQIATLYDVSVDYLLGQQSIPIYAPSELQDEKDIGKRMTKISEDLKYEDDLHLDGQPLNESAVNFLADSIDFLYEQAKKLND
ncbi:XRE family transcriptional regulator [Listeria monocytogenes]|uniref:helix-turn-helix domain-containing protein n=1 Tax=Listeria monocytogenes TaxID=1639 RepID=UPI000E72F358|nr:helix-turn-helix domain-containing protein [Listeria monocytogenes]EAD7009177.1 XRE family transcriptional regulator [Listeria monocytogenes]EAD9914298.1 XRE family transcriptional regulator [Listeria monocytogenes]EAD9917037.1 XRE family transcriptional regulator [Listeria monocytogenes]EAV9811281.1 helix-turn-helix transcriptional regulator [Listeria monocytogenes]EGA9671472.1 helix-turn-helix transcriptional regulator [Listeria monocytogenes]